MSRHSMTSLVVLSVAVVLLTVSFLTSSAAAPVLHVQGRLVGADGLPANGTVDVSVEIVQETSTGWTSVAPTWSDTFTGVEVRNGVFLVELGSARALDSAFFELHRDKALGVRLLLGSEPMEPVIRLARVPYAFYADNVAGIDTSQLVTTVQPVNGSIAVVGGTITIDGSSVLTSAGGTVNGPLVCSSVSVGGEAVATLPVADGRYVQKTGDVMTGALTCDGLTTQALVASSATVDGEGVLTPALVLAGDSISVDRAPGSVTIHATALTQTQGDARYLQLTGGSIGGGLSCTLPTASETFAVAGPPGDILSAICRLDKFGQPTIREVKTPTCTMTNTGSSGNTVVSGTLSVNGPTVLTGNTSITGNTTVTGSTAAAGNMVITLPTAADTLRVLDSTGGEILKVSYSVGSFGIITRRVSGPGFSSESGLAVVMETPTCTMSSVGPGLTTIRGNLDVSGTVTAAHKEFVIDHPTDSTKRIHYGCLEGPEAGTYVRGEAQLRKGQTTVLLPEHFALVTDAQGVTVQVTLREECEGIFVESVSNSQFTVKELRGGTSDARFDFLVQGARADMPDFEVVRDKPE